MLSKDSQPDIFPNCDAGKRTVNTLSVGVVHSFLPRHKTAPRSSYQPDKDKHANWIDGWGHGSQGGGVRGKPMTTAIEPRLPYTHTLAPSRASARTTLFAP
jgi:hypothetical protein